MPKERATRLEYFTWFYKQADFGPAEGDIRDHMSQKFMDETGKNIPEGCNYWSDGESTTDEPIPWGE